MCIKYPIKKSDKDNITTIRKKKYTHNIKLFG